MAKQRLADRVYSDIIAFIEESALRIGDRLPSEAALAQNLGASRTIIREALARLGSDGLTESRLGAGSFVIRLPSKLFSRHVRLADMPMTLGTYEVRFAIETEAARLAAQRCSLDDLRTIECHLEKLCAALRSNGPAHSEDIALHRAIMRATGNVLFLAAFDVLLEEVEKIMKAGVDISRSRPPAAIDAMVSEHEEIVRAIKAGDADRAALTMRWHLSQGRHRLMP